MKVMESEEIKESAPIQQDVVRKRGLLAGLVGAINSPWLLISIPIIVGLVALVQHPEIIINNLNKPYALAAGPVTVLSVLTGWVIYRFFRTIEAWCKMLYEGVKQAKQEDNQGRFFWFVIVVFMIVSVLEAGPFFNMIEHGALFNSLGYVTVFAIDLIAIQSMRARLEAVRVRDDNGAFIYLIGVCVCAGLSAFANTYSSLAGYALKPAGVPGWMNTATPWLGMAFPLLILLLSITADYTVDRASTKLDAKKYKDQEQKRVDILIARRDIQRDMLEVEEELAKIARARQAALDAKKDREFFLHRWLFPKRPLDLQMVVEKVLEEVRGTQDRQVQDLLEQNKLLQSQLSIAMKNTQQSSHDFVTFASEKVASFEQQRQIDLQEIPTQIAQVKSEIVGTLDRQIFQVKGDMRSQIATVKNETLGALDEGLFQTKTEVIESCTSQVIAAIKAETFSQKKRVNYGESSGQSATFEEDDLEIDDQVKELLLRYPIVKSWLVGNRRSVTFEEILSATGHTSQLLKRREKDGSFKGTKRPGYYRVNSVIEWLKTAPLPKQKEATNTTPFEQQIVSDNVAQNDQQSDPITDKIPVVEEQVIEASEGDLVA
jgi:hypothetical protein